MKTLLDRSCCRLCEAIDTGKIVPRQSIDATLKEESNASCWFLLFGEDAFGALVLLPIRSD